MEESGTVADPHQDGCPKGISPLAATLTKFLKPLSILSYLLSLPLLGCGVWLMVMHDYECEDMLHAYRLRYMFALGLLVLFIASNLVVYYGLPYPLPGLLTIMVVATIMLTIGLAFMGTYRVESRGVPASPLWLKSKIMDGETWDRIKACIFGARICYYLSYRTAGLSEVDFSLEKLTLVESGCCKPPSICQMEYVNATYWNPPGDYFYAGSIHSSYGGDCVTWSNVQTQLCYDCQSCREGFLRTIQGRWKQLGVFLVTMTILLIMMHVARFIIIMSVRSKTCG